MTTEIEKLETMRDLLVITMTILMVIVFVMGISLIFITAKMSKIHKENIEMSI
ncbi:hypothetical protein [Flavobacterium sp. LM5]|uniref:hypothetical protein n=1 Tax=Flavobacterium sp. LM5 TaxID=1938610 RepID=UPI00166FE68E|nr:hypothetical protein [Flavobacterium sp. LM5]